MNRLVCRKVSKVMKITEFHDEAEVEKSVKEIFAQARKIPVAEIPYLETRVMAHLMERQHHRVGLNFWKALSVVSLLLCVFVISRQSFHPNRGNEVSLQASVDEAMVVRVGLERLDANNVAYAEIDLPPGVYFYSKAHSDLMNEKNLMIAWNQPQGAKSFPFAIQAKETGKRQIFVRFLDRNHKLVAERILNMQFNPQGRG